MGGNNEGFIAIDALVGLGILAVAFALTLACLQTANRISTAALTTRRATVLLERLAGQSPTTDQGWSGRDQAFAWTVAIQPGGQAGASLRLCRRTVTVTPLQRGPALSLATAHLCPAEAPGSAS